MSDYDIDWGTDDGLHVEHDGGFDLLSTDHGFSADGTLDHGWFDHGSPEHGTLDDVHETAGSDPEHGSEYGHEDHLGQHAGETHDDLHHDHDDLSHDHDDQSHDQHDPNGFEQDVPELHFDPSFGDGSYDLLGADPGENDLWSQLMLDMHDEVNPYASH